MLILAVETATARVSCALVDASGVRASFAADRGNRHAEILVPALDFCFHHAGFRLADVDAFAVDVGPGLFTGLRVGLATVAALALAADRPVVPVASLDVLAAQVRWSARPVVAVLDARRGEVFHAAYVAGATSPSNPYAVGPPQALVAALAAGSGSSLLVGDGALRYADQLGALASELGDSTLARPDAAWLGVLAHERALADPALLVAAESISPLYLRLPDAEAHWVERGGVVGGGA